ncbi:DUF92 domain-containing protein [Nonomuraea lactucae]|uniref:DUF92 domain-containing protein n=1 Tax=Nonomuraea lactucae TaxID=2249762 RepID=UPI000DE28C3F|nr:DUF92 domain-containing protein [Nonomuraea lactucae]
MSPTDRLSLLWIGWLAASTGLLLLLRLARTSGLAGVAAQLALIAPIMGMERLAAWAHLTAAAKAVAAVAFSAALVAFWQRCEISTGAAAIVALGGLTVLARLPLSWTISVAFLLGWGNAAGRLHRANTPTLTADPRRDIVDLLPVLIPAALAVAVYPQERLAVILLFAPLSFALNDVFASEFGPFLPSRARMPPTCLVVPHGTPGAMSITGTLMGFLGSTLAALGACAHADLRTGLAVLIGGQVGALLDTGLRGRRRLSRLPRSNEIINTASAVCAVLLSFVLT